MNLKEQIVEIFEEYWRKRIHLAVYNIYNRNELNAEAINKILSLPVEIEEKCPHQQFIEDDNGCRHCRMTHVDCDGRGTIHRPVTLQELIDLAKEGRVVIK